MNEQKAKSIRRNQKRFLVTLLSNMKFIDRFRFAFFGNYYKPLKKTEEQMKNIWLGKK